ncbi:MAG: putative PEP-binding protein [bacterium]|nr:putative PEP-binding protein [bacterium]
MVFIARKTDPDWVPVMRNAAAIVTDEGGKTSHAAIVARELGKPCIVGAHSATQKLDGKEVTVDCSTGGKGIIYAGILPLSVETLDLKPAIALKKRLRTKVMFILADPLSAERYHAYPNDGIGLARLEFILENTTRMHSCLALGKRLNELTPDELEKLTVLTAGYQNVTEFFVSKLADGIAGLAAGVYPNQVIVRFSDFKTNEQLGLLGGRLFEPKEENPMLGFRGASRYYHPDYCEAFHLECRAIKIVREDRGFDNVKVMIPFCRTPEEAQKVLEEMEKGGLVRGRDGLEVYMMVEIPVNVLMLEDFAQYFDGFSIGSNDLTQLTMGIDRDSGALAHIADERNPAVRALIRIAIRKAHLLGKPIGICGQAPSNHPEFVEFLVECGIDTISVMPDAIPHTIENILRAEKKFNRA